MLDWRGRRVLITGGAGFVGSCLCEKIASLGGRVVIFDNFSSGKRQNIDDILEKFSSNVYVIEGDITCHENASRHLKAEIDGVETNAREQAIKLTARCILEDYKLISDGGTSV
jgi:nucleoside-diphosphate-sugar epimerase